MTFRLPTAEQDALRTDRAAIFTSPFTVARQNVSYDLHGKKVVTYPTVLVSMGQFLFQGMTLTELDTELENVGNERVEEWILACPLTVGQAIDPTEQVILDGTGTIYEIASIDTTATIAIAAHLLLRKTAVDR